MKPEELYASLQRTGLGQGPIFQNITLIRTGNGVLICHLEIANASDTMLFGFQQEHVLHSTTQDSIF
jgi:hypothetical protein